MMSWKQSITNKVRVEHSTQNCIRDLKTGKIIKCTETEKYLFDNKLSPRCNGGPENVKYRSVYYSLRKTFKCTPVQTQTVQSGKLVFDKNHLKLKHTSEKLKSMTWYQQEIELIQKSQKHIRQKKKYHKAKIASNELKFILKKIEIPSNSDDENELNNILDNNNMS